MKSIFFVLFISLTTYYLLLTTTSVVYGYDLTGIPEHPTCDLCGKCTDAGGLEQKPADWQHCHNCLYDASNKPVSNKTWTPIGCISVDVGQPTDFVQIVLRLVTGIAGGLAFLGFLWGGFQLMTSSGDPGRVNAGRGTILASVGAFLLILFSVFLLQFIGVQILALPGLS